MQTQVVQIQNLDALTLLEKLDGLAADVQTLKTNFQPKEPTQFLTRSQVCELLGISLPTVDDWGAKGILKPYRIANKVRFKRHEVEAAPKPIKGKGGGND